MRELVVASNDSNSFECGRERLRGRFEFVLMREKEIAREIRIRLNVGGIERAHEGEVICDDLNAGACDHSQ